MRKIIAAALLIFAATLLFAHPASNVVLDYNAKTMLLTVTFDHSVKNPAEHYIGTVTVKLGDKEAIKQSLTSQETSTGGSLVYKLPNLKAGNIIEVTTECNRMGKKSAKLTLK